MVKGILLGLISFPQYLFSLKEPVPSSPAAARGDGLRQPVTLDDLATTAPEEIVRVVVGARFLRVRETCDRSRKDVPAASGQRPHGRDPTDDGGACAGALPTAAAGGPAPCVGAVRASD